MADVANRCHTAGAQLAAFHHPCVELDVALEVEAGADACIEKRFVLQVAHRRDDGGEGAIADQRPTCLERALDRGLAEGSFGDRHLPRSPVDD